MSSIFPHVHKGLSIILYLCKSQFNIQLWRSFVCKILRVLSPWEKYSGGWLLFISLTWDIIFFCENDLSEAMYVDSKPRNIGNIGNTGNFVIFTNTYLTRTSSKTYYWNALFSSIFSPLFIISIHQLLNVMPCINLTFYLESLSRININYSLCNTK